MCMMCVALSYVHCTMNGLRSGTYVLQWVSVGCTFKQYVLHCVYVYHSVYTFLVLT